VEADERIRIKIRYQIISACTCLTKIIKGYYNCDLLDMVSGFYIFKFFLGEVKLGHLEISRE